MNKVKNSKLFEDIWDAKTFSYCNPYNGMEWFSMYWCEAVFKVDFGPWVKGYEAYDLIFCPITGVLSEIDHDEYLVRTCQLEIKCGKECWQR